MDLFNSLVENRVFAQTKLKVRKIYINEDPTVEDNALCPKCYSQNRQSAVRYMFINMQEAIFKCEAAGCMYPFRDFKFKNYTDNTVYYFKSATEDGTPHAPIQPAYCSSQTFTNVSSPCKSGASRYGQGTAIENPTIDFNLDFLSPNRINSSSGISKTPDRNDLDIFDSPSLNFKSLVNDFDTGFIDDILLELGEGSTPIKEPVPMSSVKSDPQKKPAPTNRKLKRCLQMFRQSNTNDMSKTDGVFKVPPLPGVVEAPNLPKNKIKKRPMHRRQKNGRRAISTSPVTAEKVLRTNGMKPLEFINSLNSIKPAEPEATRISGIQRLGNQKVERMLNFIERSMKNREPTPEPNVVQTEKPKRSPPYKKQGTKKRISLSTSVLHDTFDYSTSETEEESPPRFLEPVATSTPTATKLVHSPSPKSSNTKSSLPSFEELLHFIHPEPQPAQQISLLVPTANGFRSAGSSPTHVQQWERTPPRRIHSMESLTSLLE